MTSWPRPSPDGTDGTTSSRVAVGSTRAKNAPGRQPHEADDPRESGDALGRLLLDRVHARRNLFSSKLVTISTVSLAPDPLGHRYDDVKPLGAWEKRGPHARTDKNRSFPRS
jgi:hypothetical protein